MLTQTESCFCVQSHIWNVKMASNWMAYQNQVLVLE